jgi:O-antigen ligase
MKNKIVFNIFFALVCLALLAPLLNFSFLLYPFTTSKGFYLRFVLELALPFYVLLIVLNKNLRPNLKSLMNIFVLAFLIVSLLSAFFGQNVSRSLWGNFERMGGVFMLAHYILLYFYLLLISQAGGSYVKKFFDGLLIVSALAVLNGISGKLGGPTLAPDFSLPARVSSTLGNPIFLGSFLMLPVFLSAYFAAIEETKCKKYAYWACFVLFLAGIYLTGTRGAFAGLVFGAFCGVLAYFILARFGGFKKRAIYAISGAVLLLALVFVVGLNGPKNSALFRLTHWKDKNTSARLIQWETALKGFKESPVLGVGSENYYIISNKYYNPAMYELDRSWFDKPHNFLLEILVTNGLLGLVAYLGIFICAVWLLFKAHGARLLSAGEFGFLLAGIAAYQAQNFFVFDTVSASLAYFSFLAFVEFLHNESENHSERKFSAREIKGGDYVILGIGLAIMCYASFLTVFLPAKLSKNLNSALTAYQKGGDFKLAKQYFEKAKEMDFNFDFPEFFYKYSDMALAAAQSKNDLSKDFVADTLKEGIGFGKVAVKKEPNLPVAWYYLATLKYFESLAKGQPFPQDAQSDLDEANKLALERPEILYLQTEFLLAQGQNEKALAFAEKFYELYPKHPQSLWELARANYKDGKLKEAADFGNKAVAQGYELSSLKEAQIFIDYYQNLKDYSKVVEFYEEALKYDSQNAEVYIGLVEAYGEEGRTQEAKSLAKQIVDVDPLLKPRVEKWLK